jgi:hypothetical protein
MTCRQEKCIAVALPCDLVHYRRAAGTAQLRVRAAGWTTVRIHTMALLASLSLEVGFRQ